MPFNLSVRKVHLIDRSNVKDWSNNILVYLELIYFTVYKLILWKYFSSRIFVPLLRLGFHQMAFVTDLKLVSAWHQLVLGLQEQD